jgi:predicted DNA-binding protein (UPF0251 family)
MTFLEELPRIDLLLEELEELRLKRVGRIGRGKAHLVVGSLQARNNNCLSDTGRKKSRQS